MGRLALEQDRANACANLRRFPAAWGKTGKLSRRPLVRADAADSLKRRLNKLDYQLTARLTLFARPASRIFWK
jgi:hypothetical protein